MSFTHLHVHTQYSLLDGASDIDKLLDRAVELGFEHLAITDHGVMYGAICFYQAAKKRGINPIIGCEVYTAPRSRFDKVHGIDSDYGHLVLLAKDETGYKNIMTLVSYGYIDGYYYKPRIDFELLEKHSDGIIALSGCLRGDVARRLTAGDYDGAVDMANKYISVFGRDNYYIEIQNHGIKEETDIIEGLVSVADECGVGLVATNDVHYVNREDSFLQDVLTCIQTGKKLSDTDRLKFEGSEFYLKSEAEMAELFEQYDGAIDNTVAIANRCRLEIDFDTMHLPKADTGASVPNSQYLTKLCIGGAKTKYENITPEIESRLTYELDVIQKMGYTDYFLIVWDFIRYAKQNNIIVGPGRGSAAGSLVAYCLDITEIDPLKYDLIFERFLNPERVSMPDIDVDFCYRRRDEVKDYVSKKYGYDRVSQIITFGTLAARAAIRDVGRVMDIEPYVVDRVAKAVPEVLHIKLGDAIAKDATLKSMYTTDAKIQKLLDTAMALEGFPRNASTHAAGVVIADKPLNNYVPLQSGDTGILTQYPMANLESLGILKMDFLGLRNLTVIQDTVEFVRIHRGIKVDIKNLDYEDKPTFDMISAGDTDGVFQLENPGLQSFMKKFRPSCLEDIITTTSIYRPGPMEQIPQFLQNVNNPDKIQYLHPKLEPILSVTRGAIIYQEQVMEIVRSLAGYSFGRADLVRRAMAKKKHSVMERERAIFIHGLEENGKVTVPGCIRNGVDEDSANKIFDYLIHFANYAFNKSHAACYATVAYQTAYLKRHYPTEYLVALLISLMGNSHKINKYLKSFGKYGIRLLPPDINYSNAEFAAEGRNVRFGLAAIKNVGMQFPRDIQKERTQGGLFTSFSDFVLRMAKYDTNKRCMETLIKCGVFDSLYPNRRALVMSFERMMDIASDEARHTMAGQISLFDTDDSAPVISDNMIYVDAEDYDDVSKLAYEKELSGMYLFSHPLNPYLLQTKMYSDTNVYRIFEKPSVSKVQLCGVISNVSKRTSKSGKLIVTMTFTDYYADIEMVAFENTYRKFSANIAEGSAVCVRCSVNTRDEGSVSLVMENLVPLSGLGVASVKKLYVRVDDPSCISDVTVITEQYPGQCELYIYVTSVDRVYAGDASKKVALSNELVKKLIDEFGDDNIKLK